MTPASPSSRPTPTGILRPALAGFALLLALGHAVLAVQAMRDKSTTSDELAHVTGGFTFNHWKDFRMQPENGVLPQRWEALPVVLDGAAYPPLTDEAWAKSDVWRMGHRFFYESGNDPARLLFQARAMNAVFGAATVLLVWFWSRRLWGEAGAFVSAGFAALCPTLLAHSGLATSDMCMTFFLLSATGAYWRHLQDGRRLSLAVSAAAFGLAAVAKYTSLLLLPITLLLAAIRIARPVPLEIGGFRFTTLAGRAAGVFLSLLVHGAAVVLFVWAFFGFRFAAFNPALPAGEFTYSWEMVLSFGGTQAGAIELCRHAHLLPEGYLYGLAFVLKHAAARGAFLDGDYSIFGWVSFFPKAFFYKTPPTLLVGLAASAGLVLLRAREAGTAWLRRHGYQVAPLAVLFVVYWGFSLTSHLNIGHRHILPTYPVLYIACGALGWAAGRAWRQSRRTGRIFAAAVALLLAAHARVAAGIYPHFLAYFSPLAGGPEQGYKHLVDSSLDWGQDLPALKHWLDRNRHPGEPLYLSYFGTSEPDFYGIDGVRMAMLPDFGRPHPWFWLEPGLYAISATMLQHVYMPIRGPWTDEDERQYQQLRLNDANFRLLKADPTGHPELMREISPLQWSRAWTKFEELRFARLCHYLRVRRPDAMAGYSILIFRLSRAELDAALEGDTTDLARAIQRAAAESLPR